MFTMVRLRIGAVLVGAALMSAPAAGAATANLAYDAFNRGQLAQAQAERADFRASLSGTNRRSEGFDGYKPWGKGTGTQNLRNTKVGSFTPFGKTGSGDSVVGDGSKLQVRNDNRMRWGRYNLGGSGGLKPGNWLDSNDNRGIKWTIKDVGAFDSVGFFVSDAADVGGKFKIKVGGETLFRAGDDGRLRNGNIHFIRIQLSEAVEKLTIRLMHNINDDGFGIDGVLVGTAAPIPLPPGLLMLLPGLGLLAGVGLRQRRRNGPTTA